MSDTATDPRLQAPGQVSDDRDADDEARTGSSRWVWLGSLLILAIAAAASLMSAISLSLLSGAAAYVAGEGHWSKAQIDAVHHLHRYAAYADARDLAAARQALQVPLSDRDARLAMEAHPLDYAAAERGLLGGNNHPDDIPGMIRLFRQFGWAPHFREAIAVWRETDVHILELASIADEIEGLHGAEEVPPERIFALQRRTVELGEILRPMELAFSEHLRTGARWLRGILEVLSGLAFLMMAALAVLVLRWARRRIRDSESHFRTAFRQAGVGMAKLGPGNRFVEVNDTLCRMLGLDSRQLRRLKLGDVLHLDDAALVEELRQDAGRSAGVCAVPVELRLLRETEPGLWARATLSPISLESEPEARSLLILEDVSEARRLAEEVAYQASHDALTGLINRREIEHRLDRLLSDARRRGSRHALCFLDLDQFKIVNDTCGHTAGDELLKRLARELPLRLRARDAIGRLGGDEFAILLEATRPEGALRAAEKLQQALAEFVFHWEGRSFNLTASIGIVEIDADTPDAGWLLRAADTACYLAKEEGRNRIRVYVESDLAMTRRRSEMEWVGEIRHALAEDRIRLYAQRIEPARGHGGLRYEVLVRLLGSDGKLHGPGEFLPAAERYGKALALDRRVIEQTLQLLSRSETHLERLSLCHLNVSAQSMGDAEFRAQIAELLDASPVPGEKLCFELTETAAIGDLAQARAFIQTVRARGCKVALDDFGSGLSSYAYLKNLDFDILKIDGVFVRDMAEDAVDQAVVRSIREIGRALGKETIAEWVESEPIRRRLSEIGVDLVQGFAVHRPCPIEELVGQAVPANAAVK